MRKVIFLLLVFCTSVLFGWKLDSWKHTVLADSATYADIVYGEVGAEGACIDAYLDSVYGCTPVVFTTPVKIDSILTIDDASVWILDDTLFFTDGTAAVPGADTSYIVQTGAGLELGSDNAVHLMSTRWQFTITHFYPGNDTLRSIGLPGYRLKEIWAKRFIVTSPDLTDSTTLYSDGTHFNINVDDGSHFRIEKGHHTIFTGTNWYAGADTLVNMGYPTIRWKELWALRHMGSSPDKADTFSLYDTGDTCVWFSENPHKIESNTMVAGDLTVSGAVNLQTVTKTANYTAADEVVIICDATSGDLTITLPTAVGITGRIYYIKRIDGSVNTVTVDGNGTETIDDNLNETLSQYDCLQIVSDGSNWWIL